MSNAVTRPELISEESQLDMNSMDEKLLLTTAMNGVYVYDIRNLAKRLYTFDSHAARVTKAMWSPYSMNVFASASIDRKVSILDLNRIEVTKRTDDFHNTMQGLIVSCFEVVELENFSIILCCRIFDFLYF